MYSNEKYDERRVKNFRTRIGPKVRDYLVESGSSTIVGLLTSGRLFAVELYSFLLKPGPNDPYVDVKYIETDKDNIKQTTTFYNLPIISKYIIVVDDDIHTRQTYDEVQTQLQECMKEFNIPKIKWAVEYDSPGVADWSCNRNGTPSQKNKVVM